MITIETPADSATHGLSTPALTAFLRRARLATGLRGQVDVLLTTDATLRRLNRDFRGKNKATDVLSFPAPPAFADQHAGDLAISLETAARQAALYRHPLAAEVKILLLHGLLHLTGLDHEADQGEMAARETLLRAELRLPTSLIERTTKSPSKSPQLTSKKPQLHLRKPSQNTPESAPSLHKASSQKKTVSSRPKRSGVERPASLPKPSARPQKRGGK
ncbi:MAG: rRNA maturation RNase YbeY [Edaphobacter sp.]